MSFLVWCTLATDVLLCQPSWAGLGQRCMRIGWLGGWHGSTKFRSPCPQGRAVTHACRNRSAPTDTVKRRYKPRGTREGEERINQHCYFLLLVDFPLPEALFILSRSSSSSHTHHSNSRQRDPAGSAPAPQGSVHPHDHPAHPPTAQVTPEPMASSILSAIFWATQAINPRGCRRVG